MNGWLLALSILAFAAALVAAPMLVTARLIRRHGWPEIPAEIGALSGKVRAATAQVDLAGFSPEQERGENRTYAKWIDSPCGRWKLILEYRGDRLIAFKGVLKHRSTRWLDWTIGEYNLPPRILGFGD